MNQKRDELEKKYAEANAELEQYQHQGQRLENRIKYIGLWIIQRYFRRSA